MAAEKDMTVGDPQKIILNFHAIPVFIGNVFQQVYSMADTVIVGKFVGNKGVGSGRCHRNDQLPDLRLSSGIHGWFYCTDSTEIRSRRYGEHAENGRKCSNSVLYRSSSHDVGQVCLACVGF